jgi:hypothetical protein
MLPLNVQTLYADLVQSLTFSDVQPGSPFEQTIKGKVYLYASEKHGARRIQRYLGPASDPEVRQRADAIRRAAQDARNRRVTVTLLKRAGIPAPSVAMGRVLEVVANAGLFRNGVMLVGTGAYQVYGPLLGIALPALSAGTQDADLAAASLAVGSNTDGEDLLTILRRADATFEGQPMLDPRALPSRFRSSAGLDVDVLTRYRSRKDERGLVPIPGLRCSAQPLRYLEYLTQESIEAIALYGSGTRVTVPSPARYAVHKLIVAQARDERSRKRPKDLVQAQSLIEALQANEPDNLEEAVADARARGPRWVQMIDRSLNELGLQGRI